MARTAEEASEVLKNLNIKVIGAGCYGVTVVDALGERGASDVDLVATDLSISTLSRSRTAHKILLGFEMFQGLNRSTYSWANGRAGAESSRASLERAIEGADRVIVVADAHEEGGGIAQVVAQIAHGAGVPTVAILALPYTISLRKENHYYVKVAAQTVAYLGKSSDALIIISRDICRQSFFSRTSPLRCRYGKGVAAVAALGAEIIRLCVTGGADPLGNTAGPSLKEALSSGAVALAAPEGESFESLLEYYLHGENDREFEMTHADTCDDIFGSKYTDVLRALRTFDFALQYGDLPSRITLPFLPEAQTRLKAAATTGISEHAMAVLFLRFFFRAATGMRLSKRSRMVLQMAYRQVRSREPEVELLRSSLHRENWSNR